jgi:hypothetical protein
MKPGKSVCYEVLGNLNQHFEQVLLNLQRLEAIHLVPGTDVKDIRVFVEETRAWTNFEIMDALQPREERDWAHFGRLRAESEMAFRLRPGEAAPVIPGRPVQKRPKKKSPAAKASRSKRR